MVAHTVRTNSNMRGARPFDPTRDLAGVARLLEEAFRAEHTFPLSDTPFLREVGIALWTISYAPVFPENVTGFVWVEDGQIVGNVTISQGEGRLDCFLISNVAVKPNYRRKGIAQELMQMSIEYVRSRGAHWALLNVRPNNPGAIKLYRNLGFQEAEMRGEWTAAPATPAPALSENTHGLLVRPMHSSDRRAAMELVRAATPAFVQQFRTPRVEEFGPSWEDRLTEMFLDFFIGQDRRRWVVHEASRMVALITVRGQRIVSPHRIAVQVHPDYRGRLEGDLVEWTLSFLSRFPQREIRAAVASTHPEWTAALEEHGFRFLSGLTLMALQIS